MEKPDIPTIAAGLTPAMKAAVMGRYEWPDWCEAEDGEAELYRLGIWNPRPKWGEKAITALGLAVREYLKEKER